MPAPHGQRSANFTAAASLILITAYAEMTATHLPEQAKGVDEAKMADIFFSNCSQEDSGRSVSSLAQRFKTMTRSYRYVHTAILHTYTNCRFIKDWMAGCIRGSTGREPWWELSPLEQSLALKSKSLDDDDNKGKGKVLTLLLNYNNI